VDEAVELRDVTLKRRKKKKKRGKNK